MPSVAESGPVASQLAAALRAGVRTISENQQVSFQPYIRQVLPVDGYVFWLNANLLTASQLAAVGLTSGAPVVVSGAVHFATAGEMREDEDIAIHKMIFTSTDYIAALAEAAPTVLYIATWQYPGDGYSFKFSFSSRGSFFLQSGLRHYAGDAVYPVFDAQIIDAITDFNERQVVSNSLPFWLGLGNAAAIPQPGMQVTISLPLFPSFAIPDNLPAPYGAVHIAPENTEPLQPVPYRDAQNNRWQLARDEVNVTLYGLRNDEAADFVDMALDAMLIGGAVGLMDGPIIRDEKRTQTELSALAMKKTVDFGVSYYQQSMRDIAIQLIKSAVPAYTISSIPIAA